MGERIRRLPSITPPADFRQRVFAAIEADERRVSPSVVALSRAVTDPSLPVVRAATARPRRRELRIAPRAALAAALIGLTLAASQFLPGRAPLGGIADSLSKIAGRPSTAALAPLAADQSWRAALRLGNTDGSAVTEGSFAAAGPYTILVSCAGAGEVTVRYPSGSRTVSCSSDPQRRSIAGLQPVGASETVSVTATGQVAWLLLVETQG